MSRRRRDRIHRVARSPFLSALARAFSQPRSRAIRSQRRRRYEGEVHEGETSDRREQGEKGERIEWFAPAKAVAAKGDARIAKDEKRETERMSKSVSSRRDEGQSVCITGSTARGLTFQRATRMRRAIQRQSAGGARWCDLQPVVPGSIARMTAATRKIRGSPVNDPSWSSFECLLVSKHHIGSRHYFRSTRGFRSQRRRQKGPPLHGPFYNRDSRAKLVRAVDPAAWSHTREKSRENTTNGRRVKAF